MVDEFQDTNALQLGLVEALRGPDTRLFVVGDEFQSIYGFRHADVDVYRREHARFAEGGEPNGVALPLTGNFRVGARDRRRDQRDRRRRCSTASSRSSPG